MRTLKNSRHVKTVVAAFVVTVSSRCFLSKDWLSPVISTISAPYMCTGIISQFFHSSFSFLFFFFLFFLVFFFSPPPLPLFAVCGIGIEIILITSRKPYTWPTF